MVSNIRAEIYYPGSGFDPSASKIGYLECPDPNPDSEIKNPSKSNPDPDILFRSGYTDPVPYL